MSESFGVSIIGAVADQVAQQIRAACEVAGAIVDALGAIPPVPSEGSLVYVLSASDPDLITNLLRLKTNEAFAGVTVIVGVAADRQMLATEVLTLGADDVFSEDSPSGLSTRLTRLTAHHEAPQASGTMPVLVLPPSDQQASTLMNYVARAGYRPVVVATDNPHCLLELWNQGGVVLSGDHLATHHLPSVFEDLRRRGFTLPWVLLTPRESVAAWAQATTTWDRFAVLADGGPPEQFSFVLNELAYQRAAGAQVVSARRSARVLYGAPALFRTPGHSSDELAFTYNISADGMYVRTLAAPEAGSPIAVRVLPPGAQAPVTLYGEVRWQTLPTGLTASVPPGFGVHLTHSEGDGLQRFAAGYEALRDGTVYWAASLPLGAMAQPVMSST